MSDTRSIMCFGDSLSWGWVPVGDGGATTRYPFAERWTGVMAAALGAGYHIVEEGLSGRTTCVDDVNDPRLNGRSYLPAALASHLPLDLVILMLGTNDCKAIYDRHPVQIANGMAGLVGLVRGCAGGVGTRYPAPKVMVVAPPPLGVMAHPHLGNEFAGGREKSIALGPRYRAVAEYLRVDFLDAGAVTDTGGCDGVHFTADNNRALGSAMAARVRGILDPS